MVPKVPWSNCNAQVRWGIAYHPSLSYFCSKDMKLLDSKTLLVGSVVGLILGLIIGIVIGLLLEADCTAVCI